MAHGLLARDTLVVRDGALESSDALRHGEGASDDGHRCGSDGSERGDKDNLCKHFEKRRVDFGPPSPIFLMQAGPRRPEQVTVTVTPDPAPPAPGPTTRLYPLRASTSIGTASHFTYPMGYPTHARAAAAGGMIRGEGAGGALPPSPPSTTMASVRFL